MKKFLALILALALVLPVLAAADDGWTTVNATEKRGIKLKKVGLNETPAGVSPTTGLDLSDYDDLPSTYLGLAVDGRYQPMLVQIDNSLGGVGDNKPWNLGYADVIYESPLHANGTTRISALFSDILPDEAGPVRSARVGHTWLREEWDAGFIFYGGQTKKGSNIEDEFSKYGANKKGLIFSGTVGKGKAWKQFYTRVKHHKSPHNVNANVAEISKLISASFKAPNHAFLFTDELPDGDPAEEIIIDWKRAEMSSHFYFDFDTNSYYRYLGAEEDKLQPWEDYYSGEQYAFANVIVQHTTVKWNRSSDAPVTTHVGEGNADIFMGGVHIAGYWKRADMASRTVFYDAEGNEIQLQRGRTFISILPNLLHEGKTKKDTTYTAVLYK